MIDTNRLIKDIAFDIISVTTVWSLLNSHNLNINIYFNKKIYHIQPTYSYVLGFSFTTFILCKYL
jgi:hypothetical protein